MRMGRGKKDEVRDFVKASNLLRAVQPRCSEELRCDTRVWKEKLVTFFLLKGGQNDTGTRSGQTGKVGKSIYQGERERERDKKKV